MVQVTRPKTINVRINQDNQMVVRSSATFLGSTDVQNMVQGAMDSANNAFLLAQNAFDTANTKYDKAGGHVYGDVIVDNNLTVANTIYANIETIDAGIF